MANDALDAAIEAGDTATFKRLLTDVDDVNHVDADRATLLVKAARCACVDIVHILIRGGADLGIADFQGTPLMWAAITGSAEVCSVEGWRGGLCTCAQSRTFPCSSRVYFDNN